MLIETPYKVTNIITIKILGGDEVVGRLTAIEDGCIVVNKPHAVMMGQQGFGLAPYVLTAGPEFKINIKYDHIVCIVKTYDAVAKEYTKQTSGLMV